MTGEEIHRATTGKKIKIILGSVCLPVVDFLENTFLLLSCLFDQK